MSALFRWPCSISIHLSRRYIMCGLHPFPLTTQYFYSFVSQVCHCGRPPFSVGHLTFLFIYLLDLSLLVSAPFRWPCNISIHLFPRFVIADVRPFPLAIQHFYSFLKQFIVRGSQFFFIMCPSFLSLLALFRWPCSISLSPFCLLISLLVGHCICLVSLLFPFVSLLLAGHCVRLVSLLSPFVSGLVSLCWSLCPSCLPSVSFCFPSCFSSCWSLCPPFLPSVSFVSGLVSLLFFIISLSPVLSPFSLCL